MFINLTTTHEQPTKGNLPVWVSTLGPTILIVEDRCYASRHKEFPLRFVDTDQPTIPSIT